MMTEQQEQDEQEPISLEPREVTYAGRVFHARHPQPEQLLVWKRTLNSLASQDLESWTGHQVMAALERIRKIIDSLLSPQDIEWIDDQMLETDPETNLSRFTLKHAHELMMKVIEAFQQPTNREERRAAAKKAPAARRVAPAKKTAAKKTSPRKRAT